MEVLEINEIIEMELKGCTDDGEGTGNNILKITGSEDFYGDDHSKINRVEIFLSEHDVFELLKILVEHFYEWDKEDLIKFLYPEEEEEEEERQ